MNPVWEELASKRDRLELRVEKLLETHRRGHPVVRRLADELERAGRKLAQTNRELPAPANTANLDSQEAEREGIGPTWTIAAEHQRKAGLQERWRNYEALRDELNASKVERLRVVGRLSSSENDTVSPPQRLAWVEGAPARREVGSKSSSRVSLIFLASIIAAVTMVSGQVTADGEGVASNDLGGSALQSKYRNVHGGLLLMLEVATAVFAITAVVALSLSGTA